MKTINLFATATLFCLFFSTKTVAQNWAKTETNQPHGTATLAIDVVDKNTVWAAHDGGWFTAGDDLKISRTTDGGTNWTTSTVTTEDGEWAVCLIGRSAMECWVMTYNLFEGGSKVYATKNGGATWVRKGANMFPAPLGFGDAMDFVDSQNGFAFGDAVDGEFEIYTTSDGGETWAQVDAAKIPDALPDEYGILSGQKVHNGKAFMLVQGNRLFSSTDKGKSWTAQVLPSQPGSFYDQAPNSIAFSDQLNGLISYNFNNGEDHPTPGAMPNPIRTTDGGLTWHVISNSNLNQFDEVGLLSFVPGTTGTFMLGGFDGWFYTKDYGVNWVYTEDKNFRMPTIECLDWQTCYGGVWDEFGDTDGDVARFIGTALAPSGVSTPYFPVKLWPNPTVDELNVTLYSPYNYDINCYLQDMTTAKVVATGHLAAGSTSALMDCSGAAPGIYSLRLVSGKRVQSYMVFVKMY